MTKFFRKIGYIFQGWFYWGKDTITCKFNPVAQERLSICKKCIHNFGGICTLCGCIIKPKVCVDYMLDEEGKSIGGCPKRKW